VKVGGKGASKRKWVGWGEHEELWHAHMQRERGSERGGGSTAGWKLTVEKLLSSVVLVFFFF